MKKHLTDRNTNAVAHAQASVHNVQVVRRRRADDIELRHGTFVDDSAEGLERAQGAGGLTGVQMTYRSGSLV